MPDRASAADAVIVMVPETVAPLDGPVIDIEGDVLSTVTETCELA
jgi:hypothetical protein